MARYFYADGERHELDPAPGRIAIDTRAAAAAGLSAQVTALPVVSKLPSGIAIVDRATCTADLIARLDAAHALRPVYRSGKALVVPMPEVRVELESGQRDAAIRVLGMASVAADITDDTPDRLSLRPRSGDSDDALDLANYIYEQARPAAASVRMLQVVPKPKGPRK